MECSKVKNFSDKTLILKQWCHISEMPGLTSTACTMSAMLSNYKIVFTRGFLKVTGSVNAFIENE